MAWFKGCDLQGAVFDGAEAMRAEWLECNAKGASWRGAGIEGAVWRDCGLEGAEFEGAEGRQARWLRCAGRAESAPQAESLPHKIALPLSGHTGNVWSCGWSPDGQRIVSCGHDGGMFFWDADSGRKLGMETYGFNGRRSGPSWAAIDREKNEILGCDKEAWRYLGWATEDPEDGLPMMLPAETFGELPVR